MSRWISFIIEGLLPLLRAMVKYVLTPKNPQDHTDDKEESKEEISPPRQHAQAVHDTQQRIQQVSEASRNVHAEVDARLDELERLLRGEEHERGNRRDGP